MGGKGGNDCGGLTHRVKDGLECLAGLTSVTADRGGRADTVHSVSSDGDILLLV